MTNRHGDRGDGRTATAATGRSTQKVTRSRFRLAEAAAELVAAATTYGTVFDRAQALVEPLQKLAPIDAMTICLVDLDRGHHTLAVRSGYPMSAGRYFDTDEFRSNVFALGTRETTNLRTACLPALLEEVGAWTTYMKPAGYTDGITLGLFADGNRYIGTVCAQTRDPGGLDRETCDRLQSFAPLIASAVDPLRDVRAIASLVGHALAAAAIGCDGTTRSLPGYPRDPILGTGSPVIATIRAKMGEPPVPVFFLTPGSGSHSHSLRRITALPCRVDPFGQLIAVVISSPPGDLHGLTHRDLEVLGLLVDGCTNANIADRLSITARTAVGHVERIMCRLGVTSRTMAATQALRGGLHIPYELRTSK